MNKHELKLKTKCMQPPSPHKIKTGYIPEPVFNAEYYLCVEHDKISEAMGVYLYCLANNVTARLASGNKFFVVEEMHQHILIDAIERFFIVNVGTSPFGVFSTMMLNRAKNFLRDIRRGTKDVYGVRIGYGRGSKWIKKDYRNLKFENYGTVEDIEKRSILPDSDDAATNDFDYSVFGR